MNYVVLDLEFNQPFDFKTGPKVDADPKCNFEIIQIGAVKLDESYNIIDKFDAGVKPQIYTRIHPYVEKITKIKKEDLVNCDVFPKVYESFSAFAGNDCIFCTWGKDDISLLFKNILYYDLNVDLISDKYINVQTYAGTYLNHDKGMSLGLKAAVELLNIEIDENFHNAYNDALYTAKIFSIVHPDKPEFNTFDILASKETRRDKKKINTQALLNHFRKQLGRELTDEEAKIIKSAYKLGHNGTFDSTIKESKKSKSKKPRMRKEQKIN